MSTAATREATDTVSSEGSAAVGEAVRARYGGIAAGLLDDGANARADGGGLDDGCCGGTSCCGSDSGCDTISVGLYGEADLGEVPAKAALASLGCGHPTAVAALEPGEIVLDLGSGGGIDVLLSAKRVGPTGFAYGLDMTPEMIALANRNAEEAGVTNVEFLHGDMAAIPLPDGAVDVILSNCVINLASDKTSVFREALRVLRPGGRFAVSDIVIHGELPSDAAEVATRRRDLSAWAGCIAGALTDREYVEGLTAAGFEDVSLEITRRYAPEDLPQPWPAWVTSLGEDEARDLVGRFAATTVRARRPA